jgi:hypothetical protein
MLQASFLVQSSDFQSAGSQSWHMTCEDEINNCILVNFLKLFVLKTSLSVRTEEFLAYEWSFYTGCDFIGVICHVADAIHFQRSSEIMRWQTWRCWRGGNGCDTGHRLRSARSRDALLRHALSGVKCELTVRWKESSSYNQPWRPRRRIEM